MSQTNQTSSEPSQPNPLSPVSDLSRQKSPKRPRTSKRRDGSERVDRTKLLSQSTYLDPHYLDLLYKTEINYKARARLDRATAQIINRAIVRHFNPVRGDDAYWTKDRPWEAGIRALGYVSTESIIRRLEAQFIAHPYTGEMMSWDNFHKLWTIGHKKPPFFYTYDNRNNPGYRCNWRITNLKPVFLDTLNKNSKDARRQRELTRVPLEALDPKSFPRYLEKASKKREYLSRKGTEKFQRIRDKKAQKQAEEQRREETEQLYSHSFPPSEPLEPEPIDPSWPIHRLGEHLLEQEARRRRAYQANKHRRLCRRDKPIPTDNLEILPTIQSQYTRDIRVPRPTVIPVGKELMLSEISLLSLKFGVQPSNYRRFLRSYNVPSIQMGNKEYFSMTALEQAMLAATQPGQKSRLITSLDGLNPHKKLTPEDDARIRRKKLFARCKKSAKVYCDAYQKKFGTLPSRSYRLDRLTDAWYRLTNRIRIRPLTRLREVEQAVKDLRSKGGHHAPLHRP